MFNERICPYPGLRPFNDEESIFFKGRDRNIETIVELFEKKKFMMLTGASGDGKSSLIYAGLVPQARGGLFKAKYNNWAIADFRPERDPLGNLTRSLLSPLGFENEADLRKELSYGFSSLVKLYKQSELYLDTQSKEWLELDEKEKKVRKRKAGNLMIIADQFEEFFTNSENYNNGIASVESQVVVNLLLETAKIALAQDLPIYVICTMRSDYIGQCAAFRGLPEYIGFSQFFVPRLKRNEIQQVIEEPAMLNGDKISRRLSERLLNDISEGYDQLPILQHALNQIWKMASNGKEEMDLIHYAKVGGLIKDDLPDEQRKAFDSWFEALPESKKRYFEKPSLENILNAHANELFENAHQYYVDNKTGKPAGITAQNSQLIIQTAFRCLTKIDESRAVRNRMTLEEITQIVNQQGIGNATVDGLLRVFRKQGNTFLRPFIGDQEEHHRLNGDQVLDITHESLIRNWDLLGNWAREEHENWVNFQDFNKQLQRWLSGHKSSGYLLPIGPLTFFENWYRQCQPNKYWLARYDESDLPKEEKYHKAEELLSQAQEFLSRSARRLFIARNVMKYGANRILAAFGLVMLLFSCTYFYFDFRKKQNDRVVKDIEVKAEELLTSNFVVPAKKAHYILSAEMLHPGSYKTNLAKIKNDSLRNKIQKLMFSSVLGCINQKQKTEAPNPLAEQMLWDFINLSDNSVKDRFLNKADHEFNRDIYNLVNIVYGHHMMNKKGVYLNDERAYRNFCTGIFLDCLTLIKDTVASKKVNAESFNMLLQLMPEMIAYDSTKLKEICSVLNPFEAEGRSRFNALYPITKRVEMSWGDKTMSHGAGYYQLAVLNALVGNISTSERCLDSILKHNPDFGIISEGYEPDEIQFALLHSPKAFHSETKRYARRLNQLGKDQNSFPIELVELLRIQQGYSELTTWRLDMLGKRSEHAYSYQILRDDFSPALLEKKFSDFIDDQKRMIGNQKIIAMLETDDPREVPFNLSIAYKAMADLYNTEENYDPVKIEECYKKAMTYYSYVDPVQRESTVNVGTGQSIRQIKRRVLFNFPISFNLTATDNFVFQWSLYNLNHYGAFAEYWIKYSDPGTDKTIDADLLPEWESYFVIAGNFEWSNTRRKFMSTEALETILTLNHHRISDDLLYGLKSVDFFRSGDRSSSKLWFDKMDLKRYATSPYFKDKRFKVDFNTLTSHLVQMNFKLCTEVNPDKDKAGWDRYYGNAFKLLESMPESYRRRNCLTDMIDTLQLRKEDRLSLLLMDSLLNTYAGENHKFPNKLFEMIGRCSTNETDKLAIQLMKDKTDKSRPLCLEYFIKGKIHAGNYYGTMQLVPEYVSSSSLLQFYSLCLRREAELQRKVSAAGWAGELNKVDWELDPYEDAEGGIFFISTSDE